MVEDAVLAVVDAVEAVVAAVLAVVWSAVATVLGTVTASVELVRPKVVAVVEDRSIVEAVVASSISGPAGALSFSAETPLSGSVLLPRVRAQAVRRPTPSSDSKPIRSGPNRNWSKSKSGVRSTMGGGPPE